MKKIVTLLCAVVLISACAGMDYQYQQNMATNAVGWGLLGAGAGAAIASVTHGNVGQAATIGTVAGAALGAANTPPPPVASAPPPQPQSQPPAVYAPPPVAYAPPPAVYYAPPPVVYAPPVVYGGYGCGSGPGYWYGSGFGPFWGLGGINVTYFGGNYGGGYGHHGNYGGGYGYGGRGYGYGGGGYGHGGGGYGYGGRGYGHR